MILRAVARPGRYEFNITIMKTAMTRKQADMRSSYKRSDFGEMKRGEFVAFARAALKQDITTAKLSTSGRVTIAKAIRDALRLTAGVTLNFTLRSDGTVILRA